MPSENMPSGAADLTPEFCPHCLADFVLVHVEVKTSNPPKCGRCLLPLWWEDRSGKTPDRPWPSYVELKRRRDVARENIERLRSDLRRSHKATR